MNSRITDEREGRKEFDFFPLFFVLTLAIIGFIQYRTQ